MPTRKINKKLMGGVNTDIIDHNKNFYNLFINFLKTILHYDTSAIKNLFHRDGKPKIFVGFIDSTTDKVEILFGTVTVPLSNTTFIDDIEPNKDLINKFKLYMMSIMSNYSIKKDGIDTTIYNEIKELLHSNNQISKIGELLKIEPPAPECKPPPLPECKPSPPPPKVNDDDMLELHIYKEFGIKCILKGECHKNIDEKFFNNNPTIKRNGLKESTFRDLYVNLFEYITGSEISVFSKEKGLLSCVEKIDVALKDLKTILTGGVFNGPRTKYPFNIKTLITHINKIRVKVNESLEITGGYHINDKIFT